MSCLSERNFKMIAFKAFSMFALCAREYYTRSGNTELKSSLAGNTVEFGIKNSVTYMDDVIITTLMELL